MAAYLGSYGAETFGEDGLSRAGAVIMQYTGHSDNTPDDPPTYVCVGEDDGIASWRTMETRINNLKAQGIDTTAEGWLDDAAAFWEKQMKE